MWGCNQDRMEELERLELTSGPDIDSDEAPETTADAAASSPRHRIMGTTVEGLPPGYGTVLLTSQSPSPSLPDTASMMQRETTAPGLCIDELLLLPLLTEHVPSQSLHQLRFLNVPMLLQGQGDVRCRSGSNWGRCGGLG